MSFSQSIGDKNYKNHQSNNQNGSDGDIDLHNHPHSPQSQSKRLDSNKKSMSSPSVGAALPQIIQESPSMGSMQVAQCSSSGNNTTVTTTTAPAAVVATTSNSNTSKANDIAQDNSITSEPSETTTTTTTTSEDVVTTYKETSQTAVSTKHAQRNISSSSGRNGNDTPRNSISGSGAAASDLSEQLSDDKLAFTEKSDASDAPVLSGRNGNVSNTGGGGDGDIVQSAENSQALEDSEDSTIERHRQLHTAVSGYPREHLKVESSDVYQIVDVIRRNTNLSFDLSCEALRVALTSLEQLYNGEINPYLEAVAIHVTEKVETPKELLGITHDSKRLQYIFAQLADCKNDSEQRTWMLYEDEDDIVQFLEELVEILVRPFSALFI